MLKQIKQLHEFMTVYGQPVITKQGFPAQSVRDLAANLIAEEAMEVNDELRTEGASLVNTAKELCDLVYVALWAVNALGLQDVFEKCFDEVHNSNMSKLGEDGKPIRREDGKILKGPNYFQADLTKYIETERS